MSSIDRMVEHWREERVPLNPGASAMQLESLVRLMGVELPPDVLNFYSAVNGMHDYQHDARMVSIWSIERAVRERNIQEGEDEWGPFQDIAFADVIFSAWHLRFRVRSESRMSVIAELTNEEVPSLYALFDAFMQRPGSLGLVTAAKPES